MTMDDLDASPRMNRVTVEGPLTLEQVEGLAGQPRIHLELDEAFGWDGQGLDLVPLLGDAVWQLTVSHTRTLDVSCANALGQLRALRLSGGARGRISLDHPNLVGLALYTRAGKVSLTGRLPRLRRIAGALRPSDLDLCASGGTLEAITLVKSSATMLPDASLLQGLRLLQLMNMPRVDSIAPALASESLMYLRANSCGSLNILTPARSTQLRYVALNHCGDISSLDLFSATHVLRAFSLLGSTVVNDGRLAAFIRDKQLQDVRTAVKAGYDIGADALPSDPAVAVLLARELEAASAVQASEA